MQFNAQIIICLAIIILSVLLSIKNVASDSDLAEVVDSIISGTATIITFFVMIANYENFYKFSNQIINKYFSSKVSYNGIIQVILIVVLFCFVKYLIQIVLKVMHSIAFGSSAKRVKNKAFMYVFSVAFGVIRGFVLIVLICIPLVLYNNVVGANRQIKVLNGFITYEKMEKLIDYKKIQLITDGIKENIESGSVIYYNGITIDQAIASNSAINNKAITLTSSCVSDRDKARTLYVWIGSNIEYDNDKAKKVLNNSFGVQSGAIPAFEQRKGICFDYSCLFTAMCKAIGLKSRVIVGQAFNGSEYVSHAWNQVYLESEKKWINVDTTFYGAGDYFDSDSFNQYHIQSSVAGEF